ncbi:hypothetical protein [Scytonema sp. NUACC21]
MLFCSLLEELLQCFIATVKAIAIVMLTEQFNDSRSTIPCVFSLPPLASDLLFGSP